MIIEIAGEPGSGKTSLNTLFATREQACGEIMLGQSKKIITDINLTRKFKIPFPEQVPISANYEMHLPANCRKEFEPYWINPYLLGIPTGVPDENIQFVFPGSAIHITEGRKFWDGRESSSMPDNVSRWFETHRHNYLTIIIDAQRGEALDLNIRANANRFIEVLGMLNDEDAYGRVLRSTWYCREFYSLRDYESYLAGKPSHNRLTTYHYEGNIFECYNSRNCLLDFVPPDKEGAAYSALKQLSAEQIKQLPKKEALIYDTARPATYRLNKKIQEKMLLEKIKGGVKYNAA